jgi:uncharacterized RDD family membrane protein YckC
VGVVRYAAPRRAAAPKRRTLCQQTPAVATRWIIAGKVGNGVTGDYPTFSRRLAAWVLDAMILFAVSLPVMLRGIWSLDFEWAATATVGFPLVWYGYKILTQKLWGRTPGKRALRICLKMTDGSPVKWSALVARYFPGLVYSGFHIAGWILMVRSAGWSELQALPFFERGQLLSVSAPFWWPRLLTWSMWAWLLVNAIVLRNSAQNRAVHDLIAGTTVRHADPDRPGRVPPDLTRNKSQC